MAALDYPEFKKPSNPAIKIWRYMNFAKYVSFLDSSALYFSRADKFEDPFEGAVSPANLELHKTMIDTSKLPGGWAQWRENYLRTLEQWRQWVYVNSWHMNELESAAMWDLYGQRDEAIAIQSTYARLVSCLPSEAQVGQLASDVEIADLEFHSSPVFVGEVEYVNNYEDGPVPETNIASPYMFKRASFAHERELRAVIAGIPPSTTKNSPTGELGHLRADLVNREDGRPVQVSIKELVEKVLIAPQAPAWFGELVENVSVKYGLQRQYIDRSTLYDRPIY